MNVIRRSIVARAGPVLKPLGWDACVKFLGMLNSYTQAIRVWLKERALQFICKKVVIRVSSFIVRPRVISVSPFLVVCFG